MAIRKPSNFLHSVKLIFRVAENATRSCTIIRNMMALCERIECMCRKYLGIILARHYDVEHPEMH